MTNETKTPRTDAFYTGPCQHPSNVRQREHARTLERELIAAQAERDLARECLREATLSLPYSRCAADSGAYIRWRSAIGEAAR